MLGSACMVCMVLMVYRHWPFPKTSKQQLVYHTRHGFEPFCCILLLNLNSVIAFEWAATHIFCLRIAGSISFSSHLLCSTMEVRDMEAGRSNTYWIIYVTFYRGYVSSYCDNNVVSVSLMWIRLAAFIASSFIYRFIILSKNRVFLDYVSSMLFLFGKKWQGC